MSSSLWPHELQLSRLPCPSLFPGVCSNLYSLSQWSCVAPFSSFPQTFPASGFFPMSCLFASGGQSTGASVSALVLPMNIHGWFPLRISFFFFLYVFLTNLCTAKLKDIIVWIHFSHLKKILPPIWTSQPFGDLKLKLTRQKLGKWNRQHPLWTTVPRLRARPV